MTATGLKIARGFALPLKLVTEATAIVATRGAGKSSASAVLVEEAEALGVQTVTFDRTGVYWGLRSNRKGTGDGLGIYVLGGPHGDVPLEHTAGRLIADLVVDSGHSFVFDLSDMRKGQALRFAADFLERLYDRKARSRTTLLLVMDEAHFYAPQTPRGGFKGDAARLMGAMEDVVGLGRSRGLGVILTTQRTQAVNKAVLDLIETLFVMRMLSPRARDAVEGWIQEKHEKDERGVLASLDGLPTGTAWVWSPLRGILERVALRRIRTFDSYAAPEPGEVQVEPEARKALNLDALGEDMRATAERAKADDPRELRKRIAELEREVAERPQVDPEAEEAYRAAHDRVAQLEAALKVAYDTVEQLSDRAMTEELLGRFTAVRDKLNTVADASLLDAPQVLEAAIAAFERCLSELTDDGQAPPLPEWSKDYMEATPTGPALRSTPPRAPAPPPRAQPPRTPPPRANGGEPSELQLGKAHRAILTVLAQYPEGRTKRQLALQAGYSERGGGFNNPLGALRTAGYVTPGGVEPIRATQEGLAALGDWDPLPQGRALLEHWFSRPEVGGAERGILQALVERAPLEKDELAERAGVLARGEPYSPGGGGFNNPLGRLRTLGLVAKGWPAQLTDEFAEAIR
jgi:uncharacterized protein